MDNRSAGRGLMMAGGVLIIIGLGIVLVTVFGFPRYWLPLVVGIGLFVVGLVRWLTSKAS